MHAGQYALKYKVCNWNQPDFAPVIVSIQDAGGQEVATETFTPTINIGGDVANKFARFSQQTFDFDIPETGDYVVIFYTDGAKNADFVLGQVAIQAKEFAGTGIVETPNVKGQKSNEFFDLNGRRLPSHPEQGLYLIDEASVQPLVQLILCTLPALAQAHAQVLQLLFIERVFFQTIQHILRATTLGLTCLVGILFK